MKRLWIISLLSLAVSGMCGCQKALFPQTLPRTQYERFDHLRGTYVPAEQSTPSGITQPSLRDRLSPR